MFVLVKFEKLMGNPAKNIIQIFRPKDWYSSKATGLAGLLFLFALKFELKFDVFVEILLPAFCTLVGLAALGYLINDLSDQKTDALAGKSNFFNQSGPGKKFTAFFLAFLFAFAPWFFLPFNEIVGGFLAAEMLLFSIYSFKPIRLKDKPAFGITTDALYAHVVPALFAGYTFWLCSDVKFPIWFFISLGVWQLLAGIRNIIQHHIIDRKGDKASGSYNVFNTNGSATIQLVSKQILPFEILFFIVFISSLRTVNVAFILLFIAFLIGSSFTWRNALVWKVRTKLNAGLFSPAFFYEHRLGLIAGIILSINDYRYLLALLVYILVFQVDFKSIIANIKVLLYKVLVIPLYRIVIQPWYKYVVTPYHHIVLKNAYYYGHKIKIWLGLKPKEK